jgi:molybdate/tungstate transport system substrate-binding protein
VTRRRDRSRGLCLAVVGLGLACGLVTAQGDAQGLPVRVLYAGSLVSLVEDGLAPRFTSETGVRLDGRPGGSVALAHLVLDRLQTPDVFISADPDVNRLLMGPGPGPRASWFFLLARTALVIAYAPRSSFAPALRRAASGGPPWYRVLASPGFRLGRTDPELDPKGYRTLFLFRLAEGYYRTPGLEGEILGTPENVSQVFPEEELVGRLESGQLDAGVFYLIEAREHHLPYIVLPDAVNLGNPAMAPIYAQATYAGSGGPIRRGSPILYTVTIPSTARNLAGAIRFIQFLYGPSGQAIMRGHGLLPVRVLVGGDARGVPPALRPLVAGSFGG